VLGFEEPLRLARLLQDRLRARQQGAAVLVEHEAAPDAVEHLRAERVLQLGQRAARGGLRARNAVGAGARAAAQRRGDEHFELPQAQPQPSRGGLI
jgi:hypothetical protein